MRVFVCVQVILVVAVARQQPNPATAPKRSNPWKKFLKEKREAHQGGAAAAIKGNPWLDEQHSGAAETQAATENTVAAAVQHDRQVEAMRAKHWEPQKTTRSLIGHFAHHDTEATIKAQEEFRAGAPAPGPAPWTDDPEWVVDGKRGDKTSIVPIPDNVVRASVKDELPEQGYHGKPVKHKDLKTMTDDWRLEFGKNGPESAFRMCLKHRELYWCKKHLRELQSAEWQGEYAPGGRYGPETFDAVEGADGVPAQSGARGFKNSQATHAAMVVSFAMGVITLVA